MSNKPHLHWSHIDTYLLCGYLYYLVYVKGLRRKGSAARYTGQAVHVAAGADLTAKMTGGELLPGEQVTELARDEINRLWESEETLLGVKEAERGEKQVRGESVDTAVALASMHHAIIAPTVVPVAVEDPWVLVCDGFPFDLAGRRDITEKDGTIRDIKTIDKTPKVMRQKDVYQLSAYALMDVATGKPLPSVKADYLIKTKQPQPLTLGMQLEWAHIEVIKNYIEAVQHGISQQVFNPAKPGEWIHTPGWCGFWDQCKYGGKKRR